MAWTAWQYGDVFDAFYKDCDDDMRVAIDQRLSRLLELGNLAREPVSKHLEEGIFELRAKTGREQARFLYYFDPGKRIVIVLAIYKDQRKVSRADIGKAKKIREILRAEQEKASGIYLTH